MVKFVRGSTVDPERSMELVVDLKRKRKQCPRASDGN